ncbi:multidrug transporter [Robbsia andropogonis]|uniref:Efflux pump membrane transporter n=1 Tax=Robbsia andropogonis TaxID=28092 RepID=A0A0F5K425_9BURK|nr:efflux RND transporter permease subunit [Robbsia andropogonis]KKB64886.1 multidrug transporter [Robbsia andropogonis]MCP1119141.1 efflux RND transporter permease subunit [Robbsia andropogonis]MCP1129008.1 efflux RND transporter permease subunit [Robbsia andropogonis]
MVGVFIRRPVLACVLALIVSLVGLLAMRVLPIAQYPEIAPATIAISASYPGADPQTLENAVTRVIEQGMNGLDGLMYMSSRSSGQGGSDITLTFAQGTNADVAQMQVQNKLQLVTAQLPAIVQRTGLQVTKASSDFLMVVAFVSTDGKRDATDLDDYVGSAMSDVIRRVPGVGNIRQFGGSYAMRIWLDPHRMARYALNTDDVEQALLAQNVQIAAGELGAHPAVPGQQLNVTVTARGQLRTPEAFGAVIVKRADDGAIVQLKDVARVAIGAETYAFGVRYNGKPTSGIGISLATGANAVSTASAVYETLDRLRDAMPPGVEVVYQYDTTPFVKLSIVKVVQTLVEAAVLVFLVMWLFLQNLRATLIPTLAIPVVLLGTMAVLSVFGYGINTLTMFALVLAIGLLVDDAIVVVENVERVMAETGLPAREATERSMRQIGGALVGITAIVCVVFVPMAFMAGSTGAIYRQFSVTIVAAMLLSLAVALTLTPALCGVLLKPGHQSSEKGRFFRWFNAAFDRATTTYRQGVVRGIRHTGRVLVVFVVIVVCVGWLFARLPSGFVPEEDQGSLFTVVQLPPGAVTDRTRAVLERITDHYRENESENVEGVLTVEGWSFAGSGQNMGAVWVKLRDFGERGGAATRSAAAVVARANAVFATWRDAQVFALSPSGIPGMGTSNGFDMYLMDRNSEGGASLDEARKTLLLAAAQSDVLSHVRFTGMDDAPQFTVDIDYAKAQALGVPIEQIHHTLSSAWGGRYINDFIDRGRVKRVFIQADAPFRMQPQQLDQWHVRNVQGQMVPFSSFAKGRWTTGPAGLARYNGNSAVQIEGSAKPGYSSGQAMAAMDHLIATLPARFGHEWTGLSFEERLSGNQAIGLYAISILVVFLCLAALYESCSIPFAVLLSVPLGVAGSVLAAMAFGQSNDVYFKVGLLTIIGLSAKNAILIIEFALQRQAAGHALLRATIDAATMRLRPILMTSIAFIVGVLPLAISRGAGSGAQNAVGIGVMGGMIAVTALGIFFVPVCYVAIRSCCRRRAS